MSDSLSLEHTVTVATPSRVTKGRLLFGVGLFFLFIIFGGSVIGPIYLSCSDKMDDYFFLHSCPANEMRIKARSIDFSESYTLNLDTGQSAVKVSPYWEWPEWGLFWTRRVMGIFHTIFATPAPDFTNVTYPPDNLRDIRATLETLSDTSSRNDETGESDLYLCAWKDGHWRMYTFHYRNSKSLQHLLALLWQNRPSLPGN